MDSTQIITLALFIVTIIGAMANLIVIESASKEGVKIGFMEFLKTGLVVTLLTLPLSMGILMAEHTLFQLQ